MFSYLKGKLTEKNLEASNFVIEVSDVGYLVQSNLKLLSLFAIGDSVKIYLSSQMKDDGFKLFGFKDKVTRDIFEILISVSGVGPKAALSILNLLELDELVSAVLQDKAKIISEAQGIGPKTAKRIILELQNKLSKFNKKVQITKEKNSESYQTGMEVNSILSNLGYSEIEIDRVIEKAKLNGIQDDVENLIKFSLKELNSVSLRA